MEEFKDFSAYVKKIEKQCDSIAKVIPPEGWVARKGGYDNLDILIEHPIRQFPTGGRGLFSECLIEEDAKTVKEFARLAAEQEKKHLPPNKMVDFETLEEHYWKAFRFLTPLYGADLLGTLFDQDQEIWNLGKLDNLLNVLGYLPGVTTPYLYFGMFAATFAWHTEDMDLYSINYLHFGKPKSWYSIPVPQAARFEQLARGFFSNQNKECSQFLRHKLSLISPKVLHNSGIPFTRAVQEVGQFIITFPRAYHAGFNHGFNCAEAVNFATETWIPYGHKAIPCQCREDTVRINMPILERMLAGETIEDIQDEEGEGEGEEEGEEDEDGSEEEAAAEADTEMAAQPEPEPEPEPVRKPRASVKLVQCYKCKTWRRVPPSGLEKGKKFKCSRVQAKCAEEEVEMEEGSDAMDTGGNAKNSPSKKNSRMTGAPPPASSSSAPTPMAAAPIVRQPINMAARRERNSSSASGDAEVATTGKRKRFNEEPKPAAGEGPVKKKFRSSLFPTSINALLNAATANDRRMSKVVTGTGGMAKATVPRPKPSVVTGAGRMMAMVPPPHPGGALAPPTTITSTAMYASMPVATPTTLVHPTPVETSIAGMAAPAPAAAPAAPSMTPEERAALNEYRTLRRKAKKISEAIELLQSESDGKKLAIKELVEKLTAPELSEAERVELNHAKNLHEEKLIKLAMAVVELTQQRMQFDVDIAAKAPAKKPRVKRPPAPRIKQGDMPGVRSFSTVSDMTAYHAPAAAPASSPAAAVPQMLQESELKSVRVPRKVSSPSLPATDAPMGYVPPHVKRERERERDRDRARERDHDRDRISSHRDRRDDDRHDRYDRERERGHDRDGYDRRDAYDRRDYDRRDYNSSNGGGGGYPRGDRDWGRDDGRGRDPYARYDQTGGSGGGGGGGGGWGGYPQQQQPWGAPPPQQQQPYMQQQQPQQMYYGNGGPAPTGYGGGAGAWPQQMDGAQMAAGYTGTSVYGVGTSVYGGGGGGGANGYYTNINNNTFAGGNGYSQMSGADATAYAMLTQAAAQANGGMYAGYPTTGYPMHGGMAQPSAGSAIPARMMAERPASASPTPMQVSSPATTITPVNGFGQTTTTYTSVKPYANHAPAAVMPAAAASSSPTPPSPAAAAGAMSSPSLPPIAVLPAYSAVSSVAVQHAVVAETIDTSVQDTLRRAQELRQRALSLVAEVLTPNGS